MTFGASSMNALVIAVFILSSPVDSATLSRHQQHDSVPDERTPPALMRRQMDSEAGKDDSYLNALPEMTVKVQQKANSGHEHKVKSAMFKLRERFEKLEKLGHTVKNLKQSRSIDLCNDAYMNGTEGTSNCSESWHQQIDSYTVCETAMQLDCPDASGGENYVCKGDPFKIPYENQTDYPAGCFRKKSDGLWFFNPTALVPEVAGYIPVCVEYEFLNGTVSSMSGCPSGYDAITDEYICRTSAQCQSICAEQQFRVMDPAEEMLVPKGCHISHTGCIMFNDATTEPTCGSNCNGTPMCNATIRDAGF